jgi:hypothetical protein
MLNMQLPDMVPVKQSFTVDSISDAAAEVAAVLNGSGALAKIDRGSRVAVGVGSRGIVSLAEIVAAVCNTLRDTGAVPFIFPAMGSHGGAKSAGQTEVLKSLGIDEHGTGTEILSDANGVLLGETDDGIPLYTDKHALNAAHVVLVNRIKPHTKFEGPVESGIAKMLSVGMGKVEGASVLHRSAVTHGFPYVIETAAKKIAGLMPFRFGVAVVETPDKKIHSVSVIEPATMLEQEEELLKTASTIMPRIPFDGIDLLIVDEIGKDISGTGMDTNVIGRNRDILGDFTTPPNVRRIFVRDLTERTQGNANGIGFADFTTKRLKDKIDLEKTYKNALTAMSPEKAAIPIYLENDRQAIEAALASVGLVDGRDARVVRIKNTSELSNMFISRALAATDLTPGIEIKGAPAPMMFDSKGNMKSVVMSSE